MSVPNNNCPGEYLVDVPMVNQYVQQGFIRPDKAISKKELLRTEHVLHREMHLFTYRVCSWDSFLPFFL